MTTRNRKFVDAELRAMEAADRIAVAVGGQGAWWGGDLARTLVVDEGGYHVVLEEYGAEVERTTDPDLDAFLFRVLRGVAYQIARKVPNREATDYRRVLFPQVGEILGGISPAWAERENALQKRELETKPYDDHHYARIGMSNKLQREGKGEAEATRLADAKYPRPVAARAPRSHDEPRWHD